MAAAASAFEALKAGLDVRAAGRIVTAQADFCATGLAELDRILDGGFPRGTVATLEGPPSCGRTAILATLLAQGTRSGLAAFAGGESIYPPDLQRAGVALDRLLIVRAETPILTARAADILLRSRAFGVVAMPAVPLRAAVWSRLAALAHKAGALLVAAGAQATTELAYFASTRVRCGIERVSWTDMPGCFRELRGYEIAAHVLKHRRASPGRCATVQIAQEAS